MMTLETQDEINLWTRVYASALTINRTQLAAFDHADNAVEHFRERLPKHEQQLAGEVDRLEKMAFKAVHTI